MYNERMPAGIFWRCVRNALLIFGGIMWLIIIRVMVSDYQDLTNENKFRNYRYELFMAATGDTSRHARTVAIAKYLRENLDRFDDIVAREKLIAITMVGERSARTALHIQNPEKVPQVMLAMATDELWHKVRDDKESLSILKQLLRDEGSVAPLELVSESWALPSWWLLGILIPQFGAFFVYIVRWNDGACKFTGFDGSTVRNFRAADRYSWYAFSWPVRLSMLLLLPGALPLMCITASGSVLYNMPGWFRTYKDRRFANSIIAHGGGEKLYTLLARKLQDGGDHGGE